MVVTKRERIHNRNITEYILCGFGNFLFPLMLTFEWKFANCINRSPLVIHSWFFFVFRFKKSELNFIFFGYSLFGWISLSFWVGEWPNLMNFILHHFHWNWKTKKNEPTGVHLENWISSFDPKNRIHWKPFILLFIYPIKIESKKESNFHLIKFNFFFYSTF